MVPSAARFLAGATQAAGIFCLLAAEQRQPPAAKYVFIGAIAAAVLLIPVLFLLRRLIDWIGRPCQFCRNMRMTPLDKMMPADREDILSYFRRHEGREPETRAIFVCRQCRTVHDDFSGELRSPGRDVFSGNLTYCKVCNRLMTGCDVGRDDIRCPRCGTAYSWQVHEKSGMRFLTPPAGAKVLARCRDDLGMM